MNRNQVIEKLKNVFKIVIHNGVDIDKMDENSNITLDLGVNSVGLIYMMIAIEKEFGIDMSDVTFNTFVTVNDVVNYILERVK